VDYSYATPPAPVGEDFSGRASSSRPRRPASQLFARLVLPKDKPDGINPLTVLVEGDRHAFPGHWQRLEMSRAVAAVKRQRQLLRVRYGRDVSIEGAYFEPARVAHHRRRPGANLDRRPGDRPGARGAGGRRAATAGRPGRAGGACRRRGGAAAAEWSS